MSFTFNTAARLTFGPNTLAAAAPQLRATLGPRILLVTDPGLIATGIPARATQALTAAGATVHLYADVTADPSIAVVEAATQAATQGSPQDASMATGILGLGGGSSLDVAKLVAALAPGTQELAQMWGVGNVTATRLPLALIPTTAGTGSEVTPVAIVTTGTSEKMGVVSPVLLPDLAVLDPDLTLGLPAAITAATGIDAMVHAIEAYASASPNNNPLSRAKALQALHLMAPALERAVHSGQDREARSDMLLGSMLAGQAFANAPVAAVHALAYPIGGLFHIPHGLSNALVLPHVLRFNAITAPGPYAEMAPHAFPELAGMGPQEGAVAFAEAMADLARRCDVPQRLRDVGIPKDALDKMAADAMNQSRLLVNNPRPVTETDARAIYEAAW